MHNDGCILVNYVEEIIQITLHVYIVSWKHLSHGRGKLRHDLISPQITIPRFMWWPVYHTEPKYQRKETKKGFIGVKKTIEKYSVIRI